MALIRTVAPAELPVLIQEVKDFLHVTGSGEDAQILTMMFEAVDLLDGPGGILNRALVTQTLTATWDRFPGAGFVYGGGCGVDLPLPPLRSVSSISYVDTDGAAQTLSSSVYRVLNAGAEFTRGRVELAYGQSWPSTRDQAQAVTVTFAAGFGARNAVPRRYGALIKQIVKEAFDQRMPITAQAMQETPALRRLIAACRYESVA